MDGSRRPRAEHGVHHSRLHPADAQTRPRGLPLRKLQHRVDILDRLYTHLRRCNRLCDSSPARKAVVGAGADEPHVCRPMLPGAVRRVHAILSVALNYAVSWGWIERNPADYAHPPKLARRRALPPRPEQVADLLNTAAATDEERRPHPADHRPGQRGRRPHGASLGESVPLVAR